MRAKNPCNAGWMRGIETGLVVGHTCSVTRQLHPVTRDLSRPLAQDDVALAVIDLEGKPAGGRVRDRRCFRRAVN